MLRNVLAPLLISTSICAQRIAEIEPNNTVGTAQAVAMGVQIDANLIAGESDWFSFTTIGGELRFTTSGSTDTRIELNDAAGTIVFAGNDDARGLQSDMTLNVPAGSYAMRVFGYTATSAGLYSLDIALEAPAKPYTQSEVEPNDDVASATVLVPIANLAQVQGSLPAPGDVDVYQLVLTEPKTALQIEVNEGDTPWTNQHRVEFWDAAGALLPAATLGANAVDSGLFNSRTANTRVWPAGTYHVVVRNRSAVPTYNAVPFGSYRLEIALMPNYGFPLPEGAEPNNTIATATALPPGFVGAGSLTNSGGADPTDLWGPFVVGGNGSLMTFQTANAATNTMLDTTIRILQVAYPATTPPTLLTAATATYTTGNILETLAGSSHARGSITFFVPGATYYVSVESPGSAAAQAGEYLLEVFSQEPALHVLGSYTILAANSTCGVAPFPTLTRQFTNEIPTVGQTFSRQATNVTSPFGGLIVMGLESTLPQDLFTYGFTPVPGACFLHVTPDLLIALPSAASTEISYVFPASPSLRGAYVWEQVLEVVGIAPINLQVGNYARILVGDRSW